MGEKKYSLEELANEVELEPRTIRSYIQKDLLRGPEAHGRNAYYVEYHVQRLRKIKLLKDLHGLKLSEIRRLLLTYGDNEFSPSQVVPKGLAQNTVESTPSSTALEYIRSLKALSPNEPTQAPDKDHISTPQSSTADYAHGQASPRSPVVPLLEVLENGLANRAVPRRSRGEAWVQIQITPDAYLSVRGTLDVTDIARFEQVADCIRQYLTGGARNEPSRANTD